MRERRCVRVARDASGVILFAAALSMTSCTMAVDNKAVPQTPNEAVDFESGDGVPDELDVCGESTGDTGDDDCPPPDPNTSGAKK